MVFKQLDLSSEYRTSDSTTRPAPLDLVFVKCKKIYMVLNRNSKLRNSNIVELRLTSKAVLRSAKFDMKVLNCSIITRVLPKGDHTIKISLRLLNTSSFRSRFITNSKSLELVIEIITIYEILHKTVPFIMVLSFLLICGF
jgi:hypothetical protein